MYHQKSRYGKLKKIIESFTCLILSDTDYVDTLAAIIKNVNKVIFYSNRVPYSRN